MQGKKLGVVFAAAAVSLLILACVRYGEDITLTRAGQSWNHVPGSFQVRK